MDLRLLSLFLFLSCITAIKCWVELDIAGNDLSRSNPRFIKPKDDCDDDGVKKRPGRRRRLKNPKRRKMFRDLNNYAMEIESGVADPSGKVLDVERDPSKIVQLVTEANKDGDEGCLDTTTQRIEMPQKPRLRMIKTKKDEEKLKERRETMEPTECTEIVDMAPKTSVKIETYTVPYTETLVKYRTVTRRTVYIQRRRKIKRTQNKPILVIRRKMVKDRQFFERIIPKIVETREIINKPKIEYKIIEGPMEEVDKKPLKEEDCDEQTVPPPPEDLIQDSQEVAYEPQPDYAPPPANPPPNANGINVGFDFNSAMNVGLNAAFADEVEQPNNVGQMRSGMFPQTTECPPGMVDNGLGPNSGGSYQGGGQSVGTINAVQSVNAYGQPVLSFQRRK